MAWRVDRFQRPAVTTDSIALCQRSVRGEMLVDAFPTTGQPLAGQFPHDGAAPGFSATESQDWRTGFARQTRGEWGVIDMRMGDENVGKDLSLVERGQDGPKVWFQIRTGVNYRYLACPQQIGIGSAKCHRGWVWGQDAAQARFQCFDQAGKRIECKDFGVHGLSFRGLTLQGLAMIFKWLKRYMPRGLYGRAALILIFPVVFLQLVVSVVFIQRQFEGVTTQMTRAVAREVRLVLDRAVEKDSDPDGLAEVLASLQMRIAFPDEITGEDTRRWYDFSALIVNRNLRGLIPEIQVVQLAENKVVRLKMKSEAGPVQIEFDRARVSATNSHQLLVNMVFFGALLTLVAYLYLRNQLKPITRLAAAAEAFGRGRHVPYSPGGAVEVRAAGNAFVDMRARIERQIEQRTLMLSGVSHDLRTPLTRLRLGLSLLETDDREPLLRDVEEMQRMLDAFLSFARGAHEGEPETVRPKDLVERVVADCARGGLNVVLHACEGDGVVKWRVSAMRRALENLIENAVRYGGMAEVSLRITEKSIRVRVEDCGPGIAPQDREEALKPFARLDEARNQNKGLGVGLGLSIAADVARAHGGVLRLDESTRLGGLCADMVFAR